MGKQRHGRQELRGLGAVAAARRNYLHGRRAPLDVGALVSAANPLVELADRQEGVAQVAQLHALGLTPPSISRRVGAGTLVRVHPGVYAIGRAQLSAEGSLLAAALALTPPSLLSHRSALTLWHALPPSDEPPHVTVAAAYRRRRGINLHRASLHPDDCCALDYIPVTAPARSLLDFASAGNLAELEPGFSRQEAERRMLALVRSAALAEPRRNARIRRWEVDFFWPECGLVVEIDGYAVHSGRRAFERDRRKQAELQDLELEVLRFSWLQITEQPVWVVARLAARLAIRRARGRPSQSSPSGAGRA